MSQNSLKTEPSRKASGEKDRLSRAKILGYLAMNGPAYSTQIAEALKTTRILVDKCLRGAGRRNLVWPETGQKSKKATRRNLYRLTLAGLAAAFEDEELWNHVDEIVVRWSSLAPWVFGRWEYFKEKGLGEEAVKRLREMFQKEGVLRLRFGPRNAGENLLAVKDYRYYLHDPLLWSWLFHYSQNGSMMPDLFAKFFLLPTLHPIRGVSAERWLKALRDDMTLREWTRKAFKDEISAYQSQAQRYRETLQELEASED
jgi:hypothetical protein